MIAPLGTILPNAAQLAIADWHADRQAAKDEAKGHHLFPRAIFRRVGGEPRWYTGNQFAIVKNGVAKWFETRSDGDYAIQSPKSTH